MLPARGQITYSSLIRLESASGIYHQKSTEPGFQLNASCGARGTFYARFIRWSSVRKRGSAR
jgi:hypothetical protein